MSCHVRHLGFDRTVNSAIRSADPENLTPCRTKGCIRDPLFWGGEVVGVIDRKSDGGFL